MFKVMVLFFNIYLVKSELLVQSSIGRVDKQFLIYINANPITLKNALQCFTMFKISKATCLSPNVIKTHNRS